MSNPLPTNQNTQNWGQQNGLQPMQPQGQINPQHQYYQQRPPYQPQHQQQGYANYNSNPYSQVDIRKVVDQELEKVVPKHLSRWFGSIQYRPRKMKFATQNVGEKIYILVRMHWIKNLDWILNNLFYSTIPFVILFVLQLLKVDIGFLGLRGFVIILLAYYSILFTNVIKNFYDWYYDVYIVTNERIVDYEFNPFKGYKVMEAPLSSIEDVEEKSLGFLADLFRYGTIQANTASTAGVLSFDYIPDPTKVRDIIMDLAKIIKLYQGRD